MTSGLDRGPAPSVRSPLVVSAAMAQVGLGVRPMRPTDQPFLRALYAELQVRHGFALPVAQLRVAVDGAFARWSDAVRNGSEIAFIPPVSGG